MLSLSTNLNSFLQSADCKIAKLLLHACHSPYRAYQLMVTQREINYLSIASPEQISYLPTAKINHGNEIVNWVHDARQQGKAAKTVRRLFTPNALRLLNDSDFEHFANVFKAANDSAYYFELLPAYRIPDIYHADRCSGDAGLNDSCMRDQGSLLDIYSQCQSVQILVLWNREQQLCGRALVWTLPRHRMILMDRIYVARDFMFQLFLQYANQQGWWRKREFNSSRNKTKFVSPQGRTRYRNLSVYTPTNFKYYPYIDTFTYGNDGFLTNVDRCQYTYNLATGSRSHQPWDEVNNCSLLSHDAMTITRGMYNGLVTDRAQMVYLRGGYWSLKDPHIVQIDGKPYHIDDTVWSYCHQKRLPTDDCLWQPEKHSFVRLVPAQS